jgi:predicted phosphate transport protein (TIGR00153 family)
LAHSKWLSWIQGNDKTIIGMLGKQSGNLVKATVSLVEIITETKETPIDKQKVSHIKDLEHEGDDIIHNLFTILFQTFVTPLDREDIANLASTIDEVLNYTYGTADRFLLFDIDNSTDYMVDLSQILLSATKEIDLAIGKLHRMKKTEELMTHCNNIKKYEHEADIVYRRAIAGLFQNNNNAIEVIKLKEVYENLESSIDKCHNVSNIIEHLVLKYG